MTTTRADAIDEILGRVYSALAATVSIVGYEIEMRWPGIETATPDSSKYWGRASYTTVSEEQDSLSVAVGEAGKRRFTTTGLAFVQLFCPQSSDESQERGNKLAVLFRNSFRSATGSGKVTFRNARVQELPPENGAIRFNVVAEYEYDELG